MYLCIHPKKKVNAASLNRRDTSTCVNDLGTVDTGINTLTNYVSNQNFLYIIPMELTHQSLGQWHQCQH
jgi:hypothetical protein